MRSPRVSTVVGGAFVVWGTAVGLIRLHDNSFLTHVATGRLILAHGVPTTDPYSFTAFGHEVTLGRKLPADLSMARTTALGSGGHIIDRMALSAGQRLEPSMGNAR